jgi:hypothetical protein
MRPEALLRFFEMGMQASMEDDGLEKTAVTRAVRMALRRTPRVRAVRGAGKRGSEVFRETGGGGGGGSGLRSRNRRIQRNLAAQQGGAGPAAAVPGAAPGVQQTAPAWTGWPLPSAPVPNLAAPRQAITGWTGWPLPAPVPNLAAGGPAGLGFWDAMRGLPSKPGFWPALGLGAAGGMAAVGLGSAIGGR